MKVFNIQKCCINDGPGIRTTVFVKGCPLHCIWCHNPESQSVKTELSFDADKCTLCSRCVSVCPQGVHTIIDGAHILDRAKCVHCGQCLNNYCGCLELIGNDMSIDEIIHEVCKDEKFYKQSGGGITLSGGEPMFSFDDTLKLLQAAKKSGLHVAMETCGYATSRQFEMVMPFVDIFLYDWKETDPLRHKTYTGVDNHVILDNLHLLNKNGANIILRCPIIPGYNDRNDHFKGIADLANTMEHIIEVQIEPYHPLGEGKSQRLGKQNSIHQSFPTKETVTMWLQTIKTMTDKPVLKA